MYKPVYTGTITIGLSANEGGGVASPNVPCAMWEYTRRRGGYSVFPEGRTLWCCAVDTINPMRDGWRVGRQSWDPSGAFVLKNWSFNPYGNIWYVVGWGVRWAGTPFQHGRAYAVLEDIGLTAQLPPVTINTGLVGGTALLLEIRRPFGAAVAFVSNVAATFYPDFPGGRGSYSGGNYLTWDGFVDVASSVDVRDGLSRAAGLDTTSYADGDELRIPQGASATRYVVVKVVNLSDLKGVPFKRAYVLRDQPHWPGP